MKKLIITTCCFLAVCFTISGIIIPTMSKQAPQKPSNEVSDISLTYIVKDFNGTIAVFEDKEKAPFRVTEVIVRDLPVADQDILKTGIIVHSQMELDQVLEDYCS